MGLAQTLAQPLRREARQPFGAGRLRVRHANFLMGLGRGVLPKPFAQPLDSFCTGVIATAFPCLEQLKGGD